MIRLALLITGLAALTATGCMPKLTMEQMQSMRPERPAALDALNEFTGTWDGTGTCKMYIIEGEPEMEISGTNNIQWAADGWYLIEQGTFHMGELGDTRSIGIWSYDADDKKYEASWFDTMGGEGEGTMTKDPATGVWKTRAVTESSHGKTYGEGTVKFVGDTMEWSWTEYANVLKTMPIMEMSGTSTRTSN